MSQYIGGYGFEVGLERDIWQRGRVGATLIGMRRLAPNAIACYTGDTGGFDDCGNPLGHSTGAFATLRQYILRSANGAYLAATVGAGAYEFDGDYLGRRWQGSGPAALYGADAITPALWDVALMASIRAQLVFAIGDKPLHVTTATIGLRVR